MPTKPEDSDVLADRGLDKPRTVDVNDLITTDPINGDDPMALDEPVGGLADVDPGPPPVEWRSVVARLVGALAYAIGVIDASPDVNTLPGHLQTALDAGLDALGAP